MSRLSRLHISSPTIIPRDIHSCRREFDSSLDSDPPAPPQPTKDNDQELPTPSPPPLPPVTEEPKQKFKYKYVRKDPKAHKGSPVCDES